MAVSSVYVCVWERGPGGGSLYYNTQTIRFISQQLQIHEFAVKMAFAELSAPVLVNLKCWVKYF